MDLRVLEVQTWLNENYLQYSEYTNVVGSTGVSEDGKTGSKTFTALICALQIELGIATPTGTFGPATESAFSSQYGELTYDSSMTPENYTPKNSILILQGSFWCKGYNPGGFTGYFGDGTANAVIAFKEDVGIASTQPTVNANLMKAIMNTDGYVLSSSGDEKIRYIQQYLNKNYIDFIGDYMPTDGIYQRATNKALIYALQKEEGMSASVANGNFGNQTMSLCPTLSVSQGTANQIRILQFALYCNGYAVNDFNGVFDSSIETLVKKYQAFMLLNVTGIANMPTIKALLTSNGYTERSCKACDCVTTITEARADALLSAGIEVVGRYITGTTKRISSSEIQVIFSKGMRFFPIYQTSGDSSDYFSKDTGVTDALSAIISARDLLIPEGTVIYFAVDFDAYDYEVKSNILEYFAGINAQMYLSGNPYLIGVYGSRNVCKTISKAGYAIYSFVGDMSTGYSGNQGYSMPDNWAFDQFVTTSLGSGDGAIEIDKDGYSGRDYGVYYLEGSSSNSSEQLAIQQIKYLYQGAELYAPGKGNILVCQYARHKDYDSTFWDIVAGEIDENFIPAGDFALNYSNLCDINALGERSTVQMSHLMATLNVLLYTSNLLTLTDIEMINGLAELYDLLHSGGTSNSYIEDLFDHYGGWAGDLATVCADVYTKVGVDSDNQALYLAAANNLVGTRANNSSFGYIDLLCDVDAVNLYSMIQSGTNIADAFETYYSNSNTKRFTCFLENAFDGSIKNLEEKCEELLLGNTLAIIAARTFLTSEYGDFAYNEACAKAVITVFISLISDKISEEQE